MKAFRNVGGNIVEIEVDLDPSGNPLLPPDTTVDAKPQAQADHYVTIVDKSWVQIPIPVQYVTFESKKQEALKKLQEYRNWYLEQPVEHNGRKFDADDTARARLTQSLFINSELGYLPPAWIDANNTFYPLSNRDDLKGIISAVQVAFSTRFFEVAAIRGSILAAADEATLEAITIPTRPTNM